MKQTNQISFQLQHNTSGIMFLKCYRMENLHQECRSRWKCKHHVNILLEVEVNDDIIEKLPTIQALQVLSGHSYGSFTWRWGKLDQPEEMKSSSVFINQRTINCNFLFTNDLMNILRAGASTGSVELFSLTSQSGSDSELGHVSGSGSVSCFITSFV